MIVDPSFQIYFDKQNNIYKSEHYNVKLRSGVSMVARNVMTALAMTHREESNRMQKLLNEQMQEIGSQKFNGAITTPSQVSYQQFAYWVEADQRTIVFSLMFGLRLRGQGARKEQKRGEFISLVVDDSEREFALAKIYYGKTLVDLTP